MQTNPSNEPELLDEEQEMFEHFRMEVDPGQEPLRIDKYMSAHMEKTSRHRVQCAIKEGFVQVGDKTVRTYADSLAATVYSQRPEATGNPVVMGTPVTLYLRVDADKPQ